MRTNQSGFVFVEAFLLVVIVFIASYAGWHVYASSKATSKILQGTVATDSTNPSSKKAVKIIAVGDIACATSDIHFSGNDSEYCQDSKTYALAKSINPDAVLALGDLQYDKGKYDDFTNSYDKYWGNFKAKTFAVPGNHEYGTQNASGYFEYFGKNKTGDPSKGYYSTQLGNWQVIALNSNCKSVGGCDESSEQIAWLRGVLSSSNSLCTLLFWHHPHFTSGKYANDLKNGQLSASFWDLLVEQKADVVLNGHDHLYERFSPQDSNGKHVKEGARQFTVGTGGKSLYKKTVVQANSEKIIDDRYGLLELELHSKAYRWKFISTDNNILDTGYSLCSK